jgi:hypothetical protein
MAMLAVLDDHSKYAIVRFLRRKSDVAQELRDVIILGETVESTRHGKACEEAVIGWRW